MPIVGAGQYTCRRRYITTRARRLGAALAVALVCAPLEPVVAQARVLERHTFSDPEGKLLAFYSSAMAFSPAGIAPDESRLSFSVEVSHVPYLNTAQRRPSIDKPESTNLAPFFPRPRLSARFGSWIAELSWIPPMEVFEVEANLGSAAVTAPAMHFGSLRVSPRVWTTFGRVRGAMTCSTEEMLGKGPDLALYYATVCHGNESDDWFEPRLFGGELLASKPLGSGGARAYAVLGARADRTRFDIGVLTSTGARDADHPILELRTVRPHGAVGASWRVRRNIFAGGEVFYAPGSLVTARVSGRWVIRQ